MKRINPDWVKAIQSGVNPCPYFELQSMRIADVSCGRARVEIDLAHKHLQPFGIVHGGVISSIADAAGFWGVYSRMEPGQAMTTVELKVNFLAPTKDQGQLIGEGRCIKLGRTLGLGEATVTNSAGKVVAHATTTLMVVPHLSLVNQDKLPAKFLD